MSLPPWAMDEGSQDRPHDPDAIRDAVRAVRNGNAAGFARVVEAYQGRLRALVSMMLQDVSSAEDVVQDAFVRAYTNLHRFDERRELYPWLATIAVRLAQNAIKRRSLREAREEPAAQIDAPSTADPVRDLIADEGSRWLWQAVESLPRGERVAVLLYYRQDLDVSAIGQVLGVTRGTVKTLLFRARSKLRRVVAERESHDEL